MVEVSPPPPFISHRTVVRGLRHSSSAGCTTTTLLLLCIAYVYKRKKLHGVYVHIFYAIVYVYVFPKKRSLVCAFLNRLHHTSKKMNIERVQAAFGGHIKAGTFAARAREPCGWGFNTVYIYGGHNNRQGQPCLTSVEKHTAQWLLCFSSTSRISRAVASLSE